MRGTRIGREGVERDMKSVIVDLQDERLARQWELLKELQRTNAFGLSFGQEHCAKARAVLDWSVDALSFRSGVSREAITGLEAGTRTLRQVSMQALAFAFEQEGVVFLPNVAPMIGDNCRGSTTDPRDRADYHLIE